MPSISQALFRRKQLSREVVGQNLWQSVDNEDIIFAMPHSAYGEVYLVDFWPETNVALWSPDPRYASALFLGEAHKNLTAFLQQYRPGVVAKNAKGILIKVPHR